MSALRLFITLSVLLFLDAEGACRTDTLSDTEQLILDVHNEYRARHRDTPPLCYAEDSQFKAQKWADHVAETGVFEHYPNPKVFGENMAWSSFRGKDPDPAPFYISAAERWYSEIKNWDFELGKKNGRGITTHFTQMVWKTSTHLNCGFATSDILQRAYVVCQYWPKGNWIKRSLYYTEVHPLIGSDAEGE